MTYAPCTICGTLTQAILEDLQHLEYALCNDEACDEALDGLLYAEA